MSQLSEEGHYYNSCVAYTYGYRVRATLEQKRQDLAIKDRRMKE